MIPSISWSRMRSTLETRRLAISLEPDLFMALRATRSVRTMPTESRLSSRTAMSSSISVTPFACCGVAENAQNRLLTRAAHMGDCVFAGA